MKESSESERIIRTTLVIFFIGIVVYNLGFGPVNGAGLIFGAMVLYWIFMLRLRPVSEPIRMRMYGIGLLMLLLLLLRSLRYFFSGALPGNLSRMLWYLYYLPFTLIPMLAMDAAFLVWNGEDRRPAKWISLLYLICAALILLILTNDLHGLAFRFIPEGRQSEQSMPYDYGILYYAAVLWIMGCIAVTIRHLFRENQAAGTSGIPRILLPVLFISGFYFAAYYLGGLPTLRGRRFLQLPEAYCMFFICLMEACLQAGWFPMRILKEKESQVRESTAVYEQKNRLYESMAEAVALQLKSVSHILSLEKNDETFRPEMAKACVLTAYIKRRCNLVLEAEEQEMLPPEELRLAMAECLENLRLCGVMGAVFLEGNAAELPGRLLIEALDCFEVLAETAMEGAEALLVNLHCAKDEISLRFTLEQPVLPVSEEKLPGAAIRIEDNVWYIDRELRADDKMADKADHRTGGMRSGNAGAALSSAVPATSVTPVSAASATSMERPVSQHSLRGTDNSRYIDSSGKDSFGISEQFSALGSMITAYTIEKEKLLARIRLHDDLGKMLLLGRRYVQGKGDLESMLAVWQNSSSVLEEGGQTDPAENGYAYMQEVARDVGIRLIIEGELPQEPAVREVVISAIHECLTNTIRHAHGDELKVRVTDNTIEFTNNGDQPKKEITESGGLGMLRKMAESAGIGMQVSISPEFKLTLIMPEL